jgi:hypothetical protein
MPSKTFASPKLPRSSRPMRTRTPVLGHAIAQALEPVLEGLGLDDLHHLSLIWDITARSTTFGRRQALKAFGLVRAIHPGGSLVFPFSALEVAARPSKGAVRGTRWGLTGRQSEPESGRQGKRSAAGRAHMVEKVEEFRRHLGAACCRSAEKDQEYQCSGRPRPNCGVAPGFENVQ